MTEISTEVRDDVTAFLTANLAGFQFDALAYCEVEDEDDTPYMDLTLAISEDGTEWSYQTGDNSYTGGAYILPHWAVTCVTEYTTAEELIEEVFSQWGDLLNQ